MKIVAACAILSTALGGATAVTAPAAMGAGPCLFGHVDPNDSSSACRGSDASIPESTTRPDGTPALSCSRLSVGKRVRTDAGEHGWRHWICQERKDQWGNRSYEWDEVLGS
ncbi:hypothetical protein [Nocardia sp. NPDC052566]|uniref:hypothetical protein n=1 Tax=Nocardia sp. NPDC052566 TaxID=3364330 RepID=UPI0037C908FE